MNFNSKSSTFQSYNTETKVSWYKKSILLYYYYIYIQYLKYIFALKNNLYFLSLYKEKYYLIQLYLLHVCKYLYWISIQKWIPIIKLHNYSKQNNISLWMFFCKCHWCQGNMTTSRTWSFLLSNLVYPSELPWYLAMLGWYLVMVFFIQKNTDETFQLARSIFTFHIVTSSLLGELKASPVMRRWKY